LLAKVLAEFLFDDEKALTRIDMSEYMEKFSVSRLIGAPPGYVGYDQGGQLTEVVRRRPYSVILFDEIEKAHPDVFNILLQLLDDGRLTDGQGRVVDFTSTVIILTSNLGSQQLLHAKNHQEGSAAVLEIIHASFKPEFINRLDEIIIFESLGDEQIRKIIGMQLGQLAQRMAKRGFSLTWDPEVVEVIYKQGFDADFGARPIKRSIQRLVENPLSIQLLSGTFESSKAIHLGVEGDSIIARKG
jgi:ATP-dependent Clp protease ATP-binding subunit ClpB